MYDAVDKVLNEASDLSVAVDALIQRLQPVTSPVDSKGMLEPRAQFGCPLADQLMGLAAQLGSIRSRVVNQLETLELP